MRKANKIIGVIDHISNKAHLYYARLASGACAKKNGYDLIAATDARLLPQNRLSGVLYRYRVKEDESAMDDLAERGIPIVLLNAPIDRFPSVNANFLSGTIEAVQHLKELGRSRIAYLKANAQLPTANTRFIAFQKAMAHCELEAEPHLVADIDFGYDLARAQTLEMLQRDPKIDAIICCSDRAAMGAIHAAKQSGLRVPEDIAIIGLGNMPEIQELSDHPLTTIADPLYFEAYRATTKLIDIINHRDTAAHAESVDTHLIKRQTTLGDEYQDSTLKARLDVKNGSLDYLLTIGVSINADSRARLQEQLNLAEKKGENVLAIYESTILEAVSLGFDANLAHDLIRQLTIKAKRLARSGETLISLEDELYRISCDEITHYNRYARHLQLEMESIIEPLMQHQDSALSMKSFLTLLASLRRELECRQIGFMLLDKPNRNLSQLHLHESSYWVIDKDGISDERRRYLSDFSPTIDLLVDQKQHSSLNTLQLTLRGETVGLVFVDIDTKFGPFLGAIKPLLQNNLHLIRLFSTLEANRQELAIQKEKAEDANKAKSQFLAVISHELRTPLNCIMGMIELTLNSKLNDSQQESLKLAFQASENQLSLIDDILNFSKTETGGIAIKNEAFSLRDSLSYITSIYRKRSSDKGIKLILDIPEELPDQYIGDTSSIQKILSNLIGNAIKFTNQGSIRINAKLQKEANPNAIVRFQVKDTGIGIPSDQLNSIFDVFQQVDSSDTRTNEGVGLGLAIVKRTVDALSGQIFVESKQGSGTQFSVDLPLQLNSNAPTSLEMETFGKTASTAGTDSPKYKVLLVDDAESNIKVASRMLENTGHQVTLVYTGMEAVQTWKQHSFDLVLMDISMPQMNGYEATRRIRQIEAERNVSTPIPIIALTAHANSEEEQASIAAGMNGFINKPLNRERLANTIESVYSAVHR